MAPHSSTLAWKIPWTEEPGGLQSMGSIGVGHDWATSLSLFTFMHWRRKWQPTPVFLPGESQGREPGGLSSLGSHRVGHDWSDLAVPLELVTTLQGSGQAQIWWCIWKGFVKCKLIHKCKVVWLYLCLFFVNGFFILKCNWLTILLVSGVQWWFSIFTHWKMITMISLTTTCHHTVIIV